MAVDPINDALSRCSCGRVQREGKGTDVTTTSVRLMRVRGDPCGMAAARSCSIATVANVKLNLGLAFVCAPARYTQQQPS